MNKQEFLTQLRMGLTGLPQSDIDERLTFYSEIIDDRIEEGFSEQEAISQIGTVDEIISQIISEVPLTKLVKKSFTPKNKLKTWEIVLLILGTPVWLPLLIAAIAIIFSLYIVFWTLIVSLWAIFVSFIGLVIGCIVSAVALSLVGNGLIATALVGLAILSAGLSILLFFGCKAATKGSIKFTKNIALYIKSLFVNRRQA